jgi:hypothetical protein
VPEANQIIGSLRMGRRGRAGRAQARARRGERRTRRRVAVPLDIHTARFEPPIGIEPMTYALRGGLGSSTAVQAVTSALLAWLLSPPVSVMVQGRC